MPQKVFLLQTLHVEATVGHVKRLQILLHCVGSLKGSSNQIKSIIVVLEVVIEVFKLHLVEALLVFSDFTLGERGRFRAFAGYLLEVGSASSRLVLRAVDLRPSTSIRQPLVVVLNR